MAFATRADVEEAVVAVANETISYWDIDLPNGITVDTMLIQDLAFESIDIVQFAVAIEQAAERKGLPFEKLFMRDGNYVDDIRLSQVVDFLCGELGIKF
jgi:acyl carrier protein